MYGVILMAALTTAPSTQGFCFRARACHGCYGGCQSARVSCHGCYGGGQWYGYSGYGHGSGGYGCYAGCFGCFCYGGGYGGAYTGAHGGFYGSAYNGFSGCHGCYSACHGGAVLGCQGRSGCNGCSGCNGYAHPQSAPPSQPYESERKPERVPGPREDKDKQEQARARIRIDVPAEAKVYIDGQLMQSTATPRVFQTPDLKSGRLCFYDLRAEIVREGQVVSQSQRVILRPGTESVASFADLSQPAAAASARAAAE